MSVARCFSVRPRVITSLNAAGTPWLTDSINLVMIVLPQDAVGVPVGGDHPLVDARGGFDLDVVVGGEQLLQALSLFGGEQVGAGVQGASGPVERVGCAAAVSVDGLLDAAPAAVQR